MSPGSPGEAPPSPASLDSPHTESGPSSDPQIPDPTPSLGSPSPAQSVSKRRSRKRTKPKTPKKPASETQYTIKGIVGERLWLKENQEEVMTSNLIGIVKMCVLCRIHQSKTKLIQYLQQRPRARPTDQEVRDSSSGLPTHLLRDFDHSEFQHIEGYTRETPRQEGSQTRGS